MARFVFKLDPVLKQRRNAERDEQLAVAMIESERIAIESQIRTIQGQISAERLELRSALKSDVVEFSQIRQQAGAANNLNRRAQRHVLELAGVHKRLERAREKLLRATRRRKAMESLKDRRYNTWLANERRKEASALDELNITAGLRKEALL